MMQRLVLTLAIALTPTVASSADSCRAISKNMLQDGALLFSIANADYRPVQELNAALSDGRPRKAWIAYVANDPSGARVGSIVVKTGTKVASEAASDRVELKRAQGTSCNGWQNYRGSSDVGGRSYDRYHDYSYSAEEDAPALTAFHTRYQGRNGCTPSNDATPDSYFRLRWQSNRSQFSFDPSVVSRGQFSQFADQFMPSRAIASGLRSRRVEMKFYAMKDTPACIEFEADLRPGSFVRVVDLERRDNFARADEVAWEWTVR